MRSVAEQGRVKALRSNSQKIDLPHLQDDELSYALGKQGGTRKKLERASGLNFATDQHAA